MNTSVFLMYHSIFSNENEIRNICRGDQIYWISKKEFIWQLSYLKNNGYKGITLDQYIEHIEKRNLPPKSVIITFDDGHISNYTLAFPNLKKFGMNAEIFIVTGKIGEKDYMDWSNLRELSQAGFSIQSHTESHPFLTDLSNSQILYELKSSKEKIEAQFGKPCRYFSPPGGRYNKTIRKIADDVGYKAVGTSNIGYNNYKTNFLELKRIPVMLNTSREEFGRIIRGDYKYYLKEYTKSSVLKLARGIFGNRNYDHLREKVLRLKERLTKSENNI